MDGRTISQSGAVCGQSWFCGAELLLREPGFRPALFLGKLDVALIRPSRSSTLFNWAEQKLGLRGRSPAPPRCPRRREVLEWAVGDLVLPSSLPRLLYCTT